MAQKEPGLLRTGFRFVKTALGENALLRTSVLATVLCITLACIALASFGVTYALDPKEAAKVYSPRLFAILFLPAEFLIFDLILGNPAPRTSLKDLYLDWRLFRLFWVMIKLLCAGFLLMFPALMLLKAVTEGLAKSAPTGDGSLAMLLGSLVMVLGSLAVFWALLYLFLRFFYLNIVVARREPQELRKAFRETKGKLWKIGCVLFLPYLAIIAATVAMELLGPALERNLGFVGLAPWFLLDAGLTGFMCCLGAAVLAFSYQRIILAGVETEAPGAELAVSPTAAPQDSGTGAG